MEVIDNDQVKNMEKYLMEQQQQRMMVLKSKKKQKDKQLKKQRKKEAAEKKKKEELRSYSGIFDHANMTSNADMDANYEDNFM